MRPALLRYAMVVVYALGLLAQIGRIVMQVVAVIFRRLTACTGLLIHFMGKVFIISLWSVRPTYGFETPAGFKRGLDLLVR